VDDNRISIVQEVKRSHNIQGPSVDGVALQLDVQILQAYKQKAHDEADKVHGTKHSKDCTSGASGPLYSIIQIPARACMQASL